MNYVMWDSAWSVGVEEIDRQHRKIIDMINRLESARANGMPVTMLNSILDDLTKYTEYHFGLEEMYFDEFKYEDTARHKASHRALSVQVQEFRRALFEKRETLSDEMTRFLRDWLAVHIKDSDQRYKECFVRNGLK